MFQTDQTLQRQIFAFSVSDLVPETSDVWLYVDLFSHLDLESFRGQYSEQGQVAKDPELMLRTLFYGLTHGIVSGRKLEQVCRFDNRYIVLSGDLRPDRRTFDRFLARHEKQIPELFAQTVRLAQQMGLVKLGRVAVDGTKVRAHTSHWNTMSYEKMDRAIEHIERELEVLKKDLAESNHEEDGDLDGSLPKEMSKKEQRIAQIKKAKKEIEDEHQKRFFVKKGSTAKPTAKRSLNDSEALPMANRSGGRIFGYNLQAAVDEESQIIVACPVHDNVNDAGALKSVLDEVERNCGTLPAEILADSGYQNFNDLKEASSRVGKAIIAVGKDVVYQPAEGGVEFLEQVTFDAEKSIYLCLLGEALKTKINAKTGIITLTINSEVCAQCPFTQTCKGFGSKEVSLKSEEYRVLRSENLRSSRTDEFKESYRQRKKIVEPVFGNLKSNKGFKIFRTGRKAARNFWRIAATALNIEKIIKNWPPMPALA